MSISKVKEGFADFYSIELNELFPKNLINDEIVPTLTQIQKDYLNEQSFYKNSSEYKHISYSPTNNFIMHLTSMEILEEEFVKFEDLSEFSLVLFLISRSRIIYFKF